VIIDLSDYLRFVISMKLYVNFHSP